MRKIFLIVALFLSAMQSFAQCDKVPQWLNSYYEYWGLRSRYLNQLPRQAPSLACRDTGMVYYNNTDKKLHWFTGSVDTTFVSGAGTIPNLQQVTNVGDTTTNKIVLTRDTLKSKINSLGATIIGDSILAFTDTVVSFGDSWTFGTGASPTTLGYAYIIASNYGSTLFNRGVNGWTLVSQGLGTSMMENLNLIPVKNANMKFISFMFGLNDAHNSLSVATFLANYQTVIDTCVARGWPKLSIKIYTSGWNNGVYAPNLTNYITATITAAAIKGVQSVDVYTAMLNNGKGALLGPDSLHPTTPGHAFIGNWISRYDSGFSMQGFLTVNGPAYFNRIVNLNNNVMMPTTSTFRNPIYSGGVNSGAGIATLHATRNRISTGNFTVPFQSDYDSLDTSQTFAENSQWQDFNRGGHIDIGFGVSGTNLVKFLQVGGGANFNGNAYGNSLVKYAFNSGGVYVNGIHVVNGQDSVYGTVFATGSNVNQNEVFNIYKQGNFKVGWGITQNDDQHYWAVGNYSVGLKSAIDGTTYTPLFTIHSQSKTITMGTDTAAINGAALAVNSTTGGLLFPRFTTTNKNGLVVLQGTTVYDSVLKTISYNDGSKWVNVVNDHTITTPATGGTVNLVIGQYNIINPSGAIAALTINLPSSPANNDFVEIKITQVITAVTFANGTVVGSPTSGVSGYIKLKYDAGTTTWY